MTQRDWLIALVTAITVLLGVAAFSGGRLISDLQSDFAEHKEYCAAHGKTNEKGKEEQECKGVLYRAITDPAALATWWLVFFTALLCAGTFGLFFYAVRQARDAYKTERLAGVSAEAARSSAATALESVTMSKLDMIAGKRAYVYFAGINWLSHKNINDNSYFWSLRPNWTNSGAIPTRQLRVYAKMELLDEPLGEDYLFETKIGDLEYPASIPPDGRIQSGYFNITGKDLLEVRDKRKHLYIWGVVGYRDVFPETPRRVTKFCVFAAVVNGDPLSEWDAKANPVEIAFAGFHRHNCSDEECDAQTS